MFFIYKLHLQLHKNTIVKILKRSCTIIVLRITFKVFKLRSFLEINTIFRSISKLYKTYS